MKRVTYLLVLLMTATVAVSAQNVPEQIKAYDIDFNWGPGGAHGFAAPGLWADADPQAHIDWYADLGCNVVQTFAVSSNGYAWYKNGFVPEQPGLKHDFLTEMVRLGHQRGMLVMGYFCAGANNKWEAGHPDLCYGMDGQQIPLTTAYLDYLCASIEDALKKTDMDGFMIDWLYNPGGGRAPLPALRWLPCEQEMYTELMHEPFPGIDKLKAEKVLLFRQRAIGRAWERIRTTAKSTKPNCILWLSAYDVNSPEYQGNSLLKEIDWLQNEAGDTESTEKMKAMVGSHTRLITTLALWNGQNPEEVVPAAMKAGVGLYGFTKPTEGNLLPPVKYFLSHPVSELKGDEKNIGVLARVYNQKP